MSKRIIVAIDGPAGAGKSTIARRVAEKLGFQYIDSGAMYRAIALWASRLNVPPSDFHRLEQLARQADIRLGPLGSPVILNGEDVTNAIRAPEIASLASRISTIPGVRRALVEKQRQMADSSSVVMEGRDIGTVVFPQADVKIFLDADPAERARRRLAELAALGLTLSPQQAERELAERDRLDRTRAESPLVQSQDAVYLDTSGLTIDQVETAILKIIRERTANGKDYQR